MKIGVTSVRELTSNFQVRFICILLLQNYFVTQKEKKKKEANSKQWSVIRLLENIIWSVLLTAVIRRPPLNTDVKLAAQSHVCRKCITFRIPKIGVINPHLFTKVLWWNLERYNLAWDKLCCLTALKTLT